LGVDATLRQKIDAGDTTAPVELNTGTAPGSSEEAFNRFVSAIDDVRVVNQQEFDDIWDTQRDSLPRNQVLYGVAGYLILMGWWLRVLYTLSGAIRFSRLYLG
jgi:hypothetical protein